MQGLVVCGRCGRRMGVSHGSRYLRYECRRAQMDYQPDYALVRRTELLPLDAAEQGAVRRLAADLPALWLRNGVFTAALLRGLPGAADQHPAEGVIRAQELAFFVAEEVRQLTGGWQKPTFTALDAVPNLPLFVPAR